MTLAAPRVRRRAPAPSAAPAAASRRPPETLVFLVAALATALAFLLAAPEPPIALQIAVIAVLATVLGLPHGALDPLIARRLGYWRGPVGFAVFNLGYGAVAVAVLGLWMLAPVPSLVLFLTVSAVHFGGDWHRASGRVARPIARTLAGAALLSMPALRDEQAVADLYAVLAGEGARQVAAVQAALGPALLIALVVVAALAARRAPHEGLELVATAALGLLAPPLMFFIVYFCTLHSARHLREGFVEEAATPRRTLALVVVAYTVIPVAGAAVFLVTTGAGASLDDRLLQVVFIGLAALTVPHMVLVALGDRAAAAHPEQSVRQHREFAGRRGRPSSPGLR
ncbi:Brp/Blh family beta-carotene 15,15'-dioxygenase [Microcella daejeonensis]|uniref:Brp/Blh family beta-carotene 15,15'-dioxygenase n=1 Tax=Microcella daejeonensis TaxID=2994971 RepID=UPI00226FACCF|nr:Brp/Blh family beta-carotene 15,15'-dioxygenase [Microcella daejeonensis]WAB84525.1 Brp/Blh family beta-carotene 15,15'-dioxygenase [Microcella daejeonensis]